MARCLPIAWTHEKISPINSSLLTAAIVFTAAATLGTTSLPAATITQAGTTTVTAGGVAPGGSNANYKFFGSDSGASYTTGGPGSQPSNLPLFTETAFPAKEFGGTGGFVPYSTLQAPGGGTAFTTGAGIQYGASGVPTTFNLATFELNNGTNVSLSVYVLFGNTDGSYISDQSIGLSIDGATPVVGSVVDTKQTNDFLRFNVTGINAGDTLTISATSAATDAYGHANLGAYIGGAAFVVPEPSAWAATLAGAGSLGLVLRRRARRA